MRRLIRNIDELYTCDDSNRVLRNAWIVVEGTTIASLGQGDVPAGDFEETIDLRGSIAMPGFVNTHHHFFQTLTRAIPRGQRGHLIEWLKLFYPVWSGMTPDDLAAATAATSAELLLTGATTSADHLYLVPNCDPSFVETEIAAAKEAGIRLHLVRGSMTSIESDLEEQLSAVLGPRAGGLIDTPNVVLSEMKRTISAHHNTGFGSMVTVGLGPTTPTYSNPDYLRSVAGLASEAGVGLHMHLHPQTFERDLTRERFGKTPVEFLDSLGYIGPKTWFAHGTRLDRDDMRLLADRGAGVSHCPRMILRLGARVTHVHDMIASGMNVAVAVDGAASNDGGSMLAEMRLALLLHRLADGGNVVEPNQWLDPYDILLMSTRGAAKLIGRDDIGTIQSGKCADITAFDMRGVDFAGARLDLLSGLLLAGDNSRASLTMVAGNTKVLDGRLVMGNETTLRERVDRASDRLIERASRIMNVDYTRFPERQSNSSISKEVTRV